MPVLWLVLSRSAFYITDHLYGNGPIRVVLFWREAGKFKIYNQNSENKKNWEYCHSSRWNYQKKLKRFKFFQNFKDGWRRRTFLSASHRKCILLSETECHKQLTNRACSGRTGGILGEYWPSVVFVLSRPWANIPQYGPRARLVSGY